MHIIRSGSPFYRCWDLPLLPARHPRFGSASCPTFRLKISIFYFGPVLSAGIQVTTCPLFRLHGLSGTAERGVSTFNEALRFKSDWETRIAAWKPHATSGLALFQFLFTHIWVNAQMVANAANVSKPTAYKLIDRFVEHGLLRETTGTKRGRRFLFEPYLQLYKRL
jgi:hypothetical protein